MAGSLLQCLFARLSRGRFRFAFGARLLAGLQIGRFIWRQLHGGACGPTAELIQARAAQQEAGRLLLLPLGNGRCQLLLPSSL